MVNEKLIDEIIARIKEVMARTPAADIERNMRATLSSLFTRLDLVTREEFDVQSAVLVRTREKLAALEARLAGDGKHGEASAGCQQEQDEKPTKEQHGEASA